MDAQTCLKKLSYVGVLAFATVDETGGPQVRNISAIHYEPDALYFFTARGKDFCRELLAFPKVQVLGYTMYKEMIRLSGTAEPVPDAEQAAWRDRIFAEQPYLANVYPGATRQIGIVFRIRDMDIEYFNLGVSPIFRQSYTIGAGQANPKGYRITDACIGCKRCAAHCPQGCIDVTQKPAVIRQEHCLHCGACFEACPVGAVEGDALPAAPADPRLALWQGDITRLRADAIVNAANSRLLGSFVPCPRLHRQRHPFGGGSSAAGSLPPPDGSPGRLRTLRPGQADPRLLCAAHGGSHRPGARDRPGPGRPGRLPGSIGMRLKSPYTSKSAPAFPKRKDGGVRVPQKQRAAFIPASSRRRPVQGVRSLHPPRPRSCPRPTDRP